MKRISGLHYFLDLFINPINWAISYFGVHIYVIKVCLVLRRVYVMRICSSITKDLKFDWPIQVTWKQRAYSLVQQHERWQIFQLLSFLIPVGAGGLLKQIIALLWVIFLIRDSDIDTCWWILRNFQELYLCRPSWDSCFYIFEHICNITSAN